MNNPQFLLDCKKVLTMHWLLPEPPTLPERIDIVNDVYIMERITFSLSLKKNVLNFGPSGSNM